jgi:purine-binding chemotaxis protein CheW
MNMSDQITGTIYQLVSFIIENEEFGVDILKVQEIIRTVDITRVPRAPEFVEGVINLRGKIVPVIDLRKRFGIPKRDRDSETRIIVVELPDKVVGFLVDKVKEVIRVEKSIIEPPPELTTNVDANYITGVAKLRDRLLILLDLDKVLSVDEQDRLAELDESQATSQASNPDDRVMDARKI